MRFGRVFIFASVLIVGNVCAQEEQLAIEPPLRQSFPLETAAGGVHVKVAILLNSQTILQPGSVLRFIYLDPYAADRARHDEAQGEVGKLQDGGSQKRSNAGPYGGWAGESGNEYTGFFDQIRKEDAKGSKAELKTEVWTQEEPFRDALDHASEAGTTFVYNAPLQSRTESATMDLPEGMLLGEEGSHVRVLAIEDKSRVFLAGVRPGDQIVSLGDGAPLATLKDFVREYETTRHKAKTTGSSAYAMQIIRGDNNQAARIQVEAPPTIPSFF